MNDIKGIIEDVEKSNLVSNKIIDKVRELIGQEKWNELYDECDDIMTTTGELLIVLESFKPVEEDYGKLIRQNELLKILLRQCYKYHLHPEVFEYPYDKVEKFFNEGGCSDIYHVVK